MMRAHVGDQLVIESQATGAARRDGEIVGLHHSAHDGRASCTRAAGYGSTRTELIDRPEPCRIGGVLSADSGFRGPPGRHRTPGTAVE